MNPLTWQNPEQLFVAQVLKKIFYNSVAELRENKLSSVRRYFNSATKEYNNAVETFPSNILAGMFGFRKEVMFDLGEQRAALEEAPKIKF